jgi:phosphate starvation-inducible PhoH-like protein
LRTKKSSPVVSETSEKKQTNKDKIKAIIRKPPKSKFLTQSQEQYWKTLEENEITLCFGPAGVGKSFIAMKKAVDLLFQDNKYEKILIVRPAVEAEEKLGSLPGGMEEKLDPYTAPSFYLLNKIIGKECTENLKLGGFIEVAALAYMRGWNVDNTILIFEEAQNATPNQMKLLLTRIGFNSKFFISGDLEQTDRYKDMRQTGLYDAKQRLADLSNVGVFEFGKEDIVRNPLITQILKRYE